MTHGLIVKNDKYADLNKIKKITDFTAWLSKHLYFFHTCLKDSTGVLAWFSSSGSVAMVCGGANDLYTCHC